MTGDPTPSERHGVSIVVPFFGDDEAYLACVEAFSKLALRSDDEIVVVDNTPEGVGAQDPRVIAVRAADHPSSYYARNVGSEAASQPWLLFIDADCEPEPDILDAYFATLPASNEGAIAGEIESTSDSLLARYASSRGMLSQKANLAHPFRPAAVTANLLVRRDAWQSVGGFQEGIRSGGDTEFCWRLQDRGWRVGYRPDARVKHQHRETLRGLTRQVARHSAGASWLNRRYPGSMKRPPLLRGLVRAAAGAVVWPLTGQLDRGRFKAVDGAVLLATSLGYVNGNSSARKSVSTKGRRGVVIFSDSFPHLSETFVVNEALALKRQGLEVRVEALTRPFRPLRGGARGLETNYREDDSLVRRAVDGLWLIARHPARSLADLRSNRRWKDGGDHVTRLPSIALVARRIVRQQDRHLHAHFATSAALEAMRLSRLLRVRYSVAPHAIEIFSRPANLVEKLSGARFVSTDCDYNVRHLREILPPDAGARVHEVILGIDEARFARSRPAPGARIVGTVGRLVEKKGFADLISAVSILEKSGRSVDELRIAGDGPLMEDLKELASVLEVSNRVRFLGAIEPDEVLDLLHDIDVFALPCVIAADGDRDSMPVVVKEALAMEIPVVGTDVVGLPEMIKPEWGRLVPPSSPEPLAAAIGDLMDLPHSSRQAMGAAGRQFVLEWCNVDREATKVAALIEPERDSS